MFSRRELLLSTLAPAVKANGFDAAVALLEGAVATKEVDAAVVHVNDHGNVSERAFGLAADPDAVFLLASITKPLTAAGVVAICEKERVSLDSPISELVPDYLAGKGPDRDWRAKLTVRHLLSHTSGLPDMPPGNQELRNRQAPLPDFLKAALSAPLAFAPGTRVRYQSMGFLLAASIVEDLTGRPFRDHVRDSIFVPLEMANTTLGLGGRELDKTMPCQVPDEPGGWNSSYWRDLGAPWGGALGTARDVARFLRFLMHPQKGPIGVPATIAMRTQQTPRYVSGDRYGLGFRLGGFGPGTSDKTFGHTGATGVLAWADPIADRTCVVLTTLPADKSEAKLLRPASALIAGGANARKLSAKSL
jgi:CubicO group peptidase (beta-lactamase class C family)